VAARARSIHLGEQYIGIDLNFLLGSTVLLGAVMLNGSIGRLEGVLLVVGYIVFAVYLAGEGGSGAVPSASPRQRVAWLDVLVLVISAAGIYVGADWTVSNLQVLATGLGVSEAIVSVTVLSLGTTLPELMVSITASLRGQAAMAVGNVLGSCVFNALAVAGLASMVGTVVVPASLMAFALPFMAGSTLMFYLLAQDKRISRAEGWLFLVAYVVFIVEISGLA
jgi:cation:H+ antiporter